MSAGGLRCQQGYAAWTQRTRQHRAYVIDSCLHTRQRVARHAAQRGTPSSSRQRTILLRAAVSGFDGGDCLNKAEAIRLSQPRWMRSKYDDEIWSLALPALMAMLLDPIMNMIDAAIVGQLGTQQLGAVSLGTLSSSFSVIIFSFFLYLTTPKIAAAVAARDDAKVSQISATGMWLAAAIGAVVSITMFTFAPAIVQVFKPAEAAVALYATHFIRAKSLGSVAVLVGFVATGTFRGMKDTRSPLKAAVIAATANLGLNLLFIYGFGWGVAGSGLATAIAQWMSAGTLLTLLISSNKLQMRHLARPPPLADVWPLLRAGAALSARVVITFGMVLYASTVCVRMGSTTQAGFEILRQLWIAAIQFFECLNVATQSLCASYLGANDRYNARQVIKRSLLLGSLVGAVAGSVIWLGRDSIVRVFSKDAAVLAAAGSALPMICALFPLDAAASIMDGGLLAASQTGVLSLMQIAGSVLQYMALTYVITNGMQSLLTVWGSLKLLSVIRVLGGGYLVFASKHSAYRKTAPVAAA